MIQLQFLNKVLQSKDASLIIGNNLNESYFSDYVNEFKFILEHIQKYNNVPDTETFLSKFPEFDIVEVSEGNYWLLSELSDDRQKRVLAGIFNRIRSLLIAGKVEEAVKVYQKATEEVSIGMSIKPVDILKDTSRYEAYLEKTQDFNKFYITTGFVELDKIIGGWDREEELATIVARTNYGKCLAKGTEVLMADGTIKKVEDIIVGDKIQSLNRVNTVKALHNGVSSGYKIIPNVGDPFTISANHILTIMQLKESWDPNRRQMVTNGTFELKDITIEDYLKLSDHKKHLSKLYFPSIEYATKCQRIPAYILGLWLGDGTSREPEITTMDKEIYNEWNKYAKNHGLKCSALASVKGKARTYSISGKNGYFRKLLEDYGLIENKHIPLNYLTGSREQRIELLSGIIDTDGSLSKSKSSYEITQKSYALTKQIAQLARGIGLKVGKIGTCHNKKYNRNYYRLTITGNLSILHSRLSRKISNKSNYKQDKYIVTGFKVEPVTKVEYYGFMADGDHRYLLSTNILTHNTWVLLKCALASAQQGLKVGIYSGEMSEKKVGYRIDTLLGHISNGALIHGNLEVQKDYKQYIDSLKNIKGSIKVLTPQMINGSAGVCALRAFIEKENLDILFIDQHSLLEDDRHGKTPVEKASNISKDLKNLQVMCKKPIISVSQQNRTKNEDGKVDTTQVAQSDRIGQDSTIILFLEKKDDILTLNLVKSRDSVNGIQLNYLVNFNTGTFQYIPSEKDGIGEKEVQQLEKKFQNQPVIGDNVF